MKLTALLLFIACIHVSAHGLAQDRVTYSGREVTLEKVFSVIKKQTGYSFFYYAEQMQAAKMVTIHVKEATIEEVLSICLKDQPFEYTIKGKTIFIIKKQEREVSSIQIGEQGDSGVEVKGRITNAGGEPLSGANIIIKRTGKGTQTNANGEFTLKNIEPDETVTISYTGYASQTVKIDNRTKLILVMQVAKNELDETIVQAYGITTRRLATGNIAKVTAAEIERQPVMNPLLALQGKVAGLEVTQINGFASAPIKVELRGRNIMGVTPSTSPVSDPLYIIDGVPLTIADLGVSNYGTGSKGFLQNYIDGPAGGQSPLFNLNPRDIESIEVLKDADATAIYGSRGANGVIIITTKKGQVGKAKFNFSVQNGITKVTRFWDLLNTGQYLEMRREAFKNDNLTPTPGNAYDLLQWDTLRNTNWQKVLYGGTGKATNIQASLTGGDAHNNFRIGAGYNRVTNILTVIGADEQASVSFSLAHRSANQKLTVMLSGNYAFTKSDMVNLPGTIAMSPNAPAIFDNHGNLNYDGWGSPNSEGRNEFPFAALKQSYTAKTNFLNSTLLVSYQILRGLNVKTSLGYNYGQVDQEALIPISSQDPAQNPTGSAQFGKNGNRNWIIEPQITYNVKIGKGDLSALAGVSLQQTITEGQYSEGSGYTNDALLRTISNAPVKDAREKYGEYKYAALFGRLTYNWSNKYILSFNARRDGSSRFGTNNQFGNFGSAGIAWVFTEEQWVKKYISVLSFGKIRGSYGTTGSDAIGDYQYLTRWSSVGTQPYNGIQSLAPTQHVNPDYKWQVNKKIEGAIDLVFFNNLLTLNVAYYRNRCGNQLIRFPLPLLAGFTSVAANSPALVENKGWEFTASIRIFKSPKFSWSINLNTAFNRNRLLEYPNLEQSPFASQLIVGHPLNITKLLHYTGVDPQTGEYTFEDLDKNGQVNIDLSGLPDDRYIYDMTPKFFGGLGMDFMFKGLQANLYFNIRRQKGFNAVRQGNIPGGIKNQPTGVMENRWQNPGDIASIARFTTGQATSDYNFIGFSDGGFTDASFIRLSTLSLSYKLPNAWLKKARLKGCSLLVNSNNLFVITKFKGIDPETQNFGGMPPTRTITGGINLNF